MFATLDAFFSYWRRRIAESTLAGIHDASQALATGAAEQIESSDAPESVILLLDGPKPQTSKRKAGGS